MRKITKNREPHSFTTYKRTSNTSFEDLDSNIKNDVKNSLLEEQKSVCAYCQQKINNDNMKIEHWCEQSICNGTQSFPDMRLDYTNLLAVFSGVSNREVHCDQKKSEYTINNGLPITISPLIQAHIDTITYNKSGIIKSSNDTYNNEINNILNLNTPFLKNKRKTKWELIFKNSYDRKHKINKAKMRRILEKNIELSSSYVDIEFIGLSEFILQKYCFK